MAVKKFNPVIFIKITSSALYNHLIDKFAILSYYHPAYFGGIYIDFSKIALDLAFLHKHNGLNN